MSSAEPWTLLELSNAMGKALDERLGVVKVRGEIASWKPYPSGIYISLREGNVSLKAICWTAQWKTLGKPPCTEGQSVVVTGRLRIYAQRSEYSLIVQTLEVAGVGDLLQTLERLKQSLLSAGFFAQKRPLPAFPWRIGLVTSSAGAVLHDIVHRLQDRFPCSHVTVWSVAVQGKQAVSDIVEALAGMAILRPDVVILARGGGSFEDLLPFSDETLVKAVFACPVPTVSAVGHETDTTLVDYAADVRAPTPSAAAERVAPVRTEILSGIAHLFSRVQRRQKTLLELKRAQLSTVWARIPHPTQERQKRLVRLEGLERRLEAALRGLPVRVADFQKRLLHLEHSLVANARHFLTKRQTLLQGLERALAESSVQKRLADGYAIVRDAQGRCPPSPALLVPGASLTITLATGTVMVSVVSFDPS